MYRSYYDNDANQLWIKTAYEDDESHGCYKEYYPNGWLKKKVGYRHGKVHGEYREYDKHGNLVIETSYHDGEIHGEYKEYETCFFGLIKKVKRALYVHGVEVVENGAFSVNKINGMNRQNPNNR